MAYFLGSDAKVSLTTEDTTYGVNVGNWSGGDVYRVSGASTVNNGIDKMSASNLATGSSLADLTALDLGIGATDEDVSYIGVKTPLKAEVHKTTTVTLTFKKKNAVFDAIFSGDSAGNIGRWGVKNSGDLYDGLTEPGVDGERTFGYRLAIHLKDSGDTAEVMTVRNAQMTGHTVTLNADGTQEQTIEFTSMVQPIISGAARATATPAGDF
jgi:hypothetical protein